MSSDALSISLQENLLAMLAFDTEHCMLIRNSIEPGLFASTVYKDVVVRIYDFLDQFGKPPADHLPDLVEDVLTGEDANKAELYSDLLESIDKLRTHVNSQYVLNQLESFVRRQKLMAGVIQAHSHVEAGDLEEAEAVLEKAMRSRLALFQPGITLLQGLDKLKAQENLSVDSVILNIPDLDKRLLIPTRKELYLTIIPPKRGKTWFCVHAGKQALLQRWKVAHITLEMSEERMVQRYLQSLYSMTKREAVVQVTKFEKDELGRIVNFNTLELNKRPVLTEVSVQKDLSKRLKKWRMEGNLIVKNFPTGSLTVNALKVYLDSLERIHKFIPDLLIVDYPDLMQVDAHIYRHDISRIFKELRGIAVERNIALITPTQSNRSGAKSRLVSETDVSEDWSKIMICDVGITYSQTPEERKLGLARLFVANGRNDEDKFAILITQSYAIGQFCLDSVWMSDSYWALIDGASNAISDPDKD